MSVLQSIEGHSLTQQRPKNDQSLASLVLHLFFKKTTWGKWKTHDIQIILKNKTSNRSNTWLSSGIIPSNTICWWLGRCCMVLAASCCARWLACCLRMAAVKPLMPRQMAAEMKLEVGVIWKSPKCWWFSLQKLWVISRDFVLGLADCKLWRDAKGMQR